MEEGPNPQVGRHAFNVRRVDASTGHCADPAVRNALARQRTQDGRSAPRGVCDSRIADRAEVGGNLVGEHLLQSQAEEMRCVAAVRTRGDVAAESRRPARASMPSRAAVGQARADGEVDVDVAEPVPKGCALAFEPRELALKELPSPADRAKWIEDDDVLRCIRIGTPASVPDLRWV